MNGNAMTWMRSFDSFDYGEKPRSMSLMEAANEAQKLTAQDPSHFYRVVPIDEAMTGFTIEKISKEKEWLRSSRRCAGAFDRTPYSYHYR